MLTTKTKSLTCSCQGIYVQISASRQFRWCDLKLETDSSWCTIKGSSDCLNLLSVFFLSHTYAFEEIPSGVAVKNGRMCPNTSFQRRSLDWQCADVWLRCRFAERIDLVPSALRFGWVLGSLSSFGWHSWSPTRHFYSYVGCTRTSWPFWRCIASVPDDEGVTFQAVAENIVEQWKKVEYSSCSNFLSVTMSSNCLSFQGANVLRLRVRGVRVEFCLFCFLPLQFSSLHAYHAACTKSYHICKWVANYRRCGACKVRVCRMQRITKATRAWMQ